MPPFHGVLGEDDSDAESIATFIRRLRLSAGLAPIKIKLRGFNGCSGLLRKGAAQLAAWETAGCVRAYICYDADNDPNQTPTDRLEVIRRLVNDSKVAIEVCCVVPVEELEAWFHADIEKLGELYSWCGGLKQDPTPERIHHPPPQGKAQVREQKSEKPQVLLPSGHRQSADGRIGPDRTTRGTLPLVPAVRRIRPASVTACIATSSAEVVPPKLSHPKPYKTGGQCPPQCPPYGSHEG